MEQKRSYVISSDAGGTMTDMFITDEKGDFVVVKGPSTPGRDAVGFINALKDAVAELGVDFEKDAKKILPYLKHGDRILQAERVIKNIDERNQKYGFIGM